MKTYEFLIVEIDSAGDMVDDNDTDMTLDDLGDDGWQCVCALPGRIFANSFAGFNWQPTQYNDRLVLQREHEGER